MYSHIVNIRTRYSETDRMGFVYYGNYATYFEVARVEALRNIGVLYRKYEDVGIVMPVLNLNIDYKKPGLYDELLEIKVTIPELPELRVRFTYETRNEKGELLNTAETTLVFMNKTSGRPVRVPEEFVNALKPFYQ